MRKLLLGVLAVACAMVVVAAIPRADAASGPAAARECGLPAASPLWIDFGDGSVPFWDLFAKPGLVSAAANFVYPPRIRALGGNTVYFDLNFHRRMRGPSRPVDPATIPELANRLFDYAAASSGCTRPWIALNELFGANLPTPWSATNAQYRANVLEFIRIMAARGGHPFLLVNSRTYTEGEAGDWWREVAKVADIVREVYFPAPAIYRQGAALGSRTLRQAFRRGILDFASIGIPVTKLGIFLGFHTERGKGGREGLQPARAWYETVKWQALAARQVARELKFSTIWSWGWGQWGGQSVDADKAGAACVYLWTRDPRLCNGPKVAGPGFNASRTEGQINLPGGIQCTVGAAKIRNADIKPLARLTGDRQAAVTALFERILLRRIGKVKPVDVLAAERSIVSARFGGSSAAYRGALRRAGASVAMARGAIGDELVRLQIERRFRVARPTSGQISDYYSSYESVAARPMQAKPAANWLGGKRGIALESFAPPQVFKLREGRWATIQTVAGKVKVRPTGPAVPLGATSLAQARPAIRAALVAAAKQNAFQSWSVRQQKRGLKEAVCRRDELPQVDSVDLTSFLPFLALSV